MLVDVVPQPSDPARYRIRLAGTAVVGIQGADNTGRYVDEVLTAEEGAAIVRNYEEIISSRRPQFRHGTVATRGREHVIYERVAFPLATDGEHVDMLVFIFVRLST